MPNYELHLVSDGKKSLVQFADIASQVEPFVTYFHLREKHRTASELWEGIGHLIDRGIPHDKIIINDRVDVAIAAGVKGTQLAYHSLEPKWVKRSFPTLRVGRSVHSVKEAREMESQQADYLIYGHIFSSNSKPGIQARGVEALSHVVNQVNIPVVAIGGIEPNHVPAVLQAGATGIAIMSGILESGEPDVVAKLYANALQRGTM